MFAKSHYERLRKVYSLWICTDPPQYLRNTIAIYHIAEDSIIGYSRDDDKNYDMLAVVRSCLGTAEDENYRGILKILGVLLSADIDPGEKKRVLHDEFNIPITDNIEMEMNEMCNLGEALYRKGEARGIKMGIEQNIIASIQSLMSTLKLNAQEAMNALRIPERAAAVFGENSPLIICVRAS